MSNRYLLLIISLIVAGVFSFHANESDPGTSGSGTAGSSDDPVPTDTIPADTIPADTIPVDPAPAVDVPMISFVTDDNIADVQSKVDYVQARFNLAGRGSCDSVSTTVSVRGRGNSSWNAPKKPYRLKFDKKISLAGLPKAKSYVLLATWDDPTSMQFVLACRLGQILGLPYTNQIVPVEVTFNGNYRGAYQLTNKPGINSGSFDINEETSVMWELDEIFDEEMKFKSPVYNSPVNLSDPDMGSDNFSRWKSDFEKMEQAVSEGRYSEYFSPRELARYFIIYDLMHCGDIRSPRSVKMFKSQGLKYIMGPIWDFDFSMGASWPPGPDNWYSESLLRHKLVLGDFLKTLSTAAEVKEEYSIALHEIADQREEIISYLDEYAARIRPSMLRNHELWSTQYSDWDSWYEKMKSWFTKRLDVMLGWDSLPSLPSGSGDSGTTAPSDSISTPVGPLQIAVTPEPGSAFAQSFDTPFMQIKLTFDREVWPKKKSFTLTDQQGNLVDLEMAGLYNSECPLFEYRLADQPYFLTLNFNSDALLPQGTYTLTVAPGALSYGDGESNAEELKYVWTYASAQNHGYLCAVLPEPGSVLPRDRATTMTLVFSDPVSVDLSRSAIALAGREVARLKPASGSQFDAVWTAIIPPVQGTDSISVDSICSGRLTLTAYATDITGSPVSGNAGKKDDTRFEYSYSYQANPPILRVADSDLRRPSISTLHLSAIAADGSAASFAPTWKTFPELRDLAGRLVSEVLHDATGPQRARAYSSPRSESTSDLSSAWMELEFKRRVTTPGTYILHVPAGCFEFSADGSTCENEATDFVFEVVEFVNLDYRVDSHQWSAQPVEACSSATVRIAPAEGWRLASLSLDGKDVTADVQGESYTTPALLRDALLEASFECDCDVFETSGVGGVVSDLGLRVWSDGQLLTVDGLEAGYHVAVFTEGGCRVADYTLPDSTGSRSVSFSLPSAVYIITVSAPGSRSAAIKILHH